MSELIKPSKEVVRAALWRAGQLRWKLDECQASIYDSFHSAKGRKFFLNASRRLGKSYFLCVLALEKCLQLPYAQVKFAAPTQRMCKRVIFPIFREILLDCPHDLKPEFFAQEQIFEFKNGSTITIAAMDAGRADNLRGTDAHLCIVDEAGFTNSLYLEEMIGSVMMPMLLLTGGKLIIASTPAKTPRHYFETAFIEAMKDGAAVHKTIYDNARITPELIKEFMKEAGGETSTAWRREYLGEFVVDEELVVIPEFDHAKKAEIVREEPVPPYFDAYVSMDFGTKDGTAILFGFFDFKKARLVIQDEIWLYGLKELRTDIIANFIAEKEQQLWKDKKPYFRISDVDPLLISDLSNLHGLKFVKTDQDLKEAGVNELRIAIKNNTVAINPRCKQLVAQLQACVWNSKRDEFMRIPGYGHFDCVDALIYLLRGIRRNHNPYPVEFYKEDQFYAEQKSSKTNNAHLFEQLFKPKKFF